MKQRKKRRRGRNAYVLMVFSEVLVKTNTPTETEKRISAKTMAKVQFMCKVQKFMKDELTVEK